MPRSPQQIAADLDFYFNTADSQMGFSSSFKSFIQRMEGNHLVASMEPVMDDRILKAVRKYNKIHNTLTKLTSQERSILSATYDQEIIIPPFLRRYFEKYAAASCFNTILPIQQLITLFTSTTTKGLSKPQQVQLTEIKCQAKHLFQLAHQAYSDHYGEL